MPLFDNIKTLDKRPHLTVEQHAYFRSMLLNSFVAINNNPAMTEEAISQKLVLVEDLTVVKRELRHKKLLIEIHYLFNNVPFLLEVYAYFDKAGDYLHYLVLDGEPTGSSVNHVLDLLPIHRGDFSIQLDIGTNPIYSTSGKENRYMAQFANVFNFEEQKNIPHLTVNYEIHNKAIVRKYLKYKKGCSWERVRDCDFNIEHEPYFIDFMNLLFSGESALINHYIHSKFFNHYDRLNGFIPSSLDSVLMNLHNHPDILDSTVSLALKGAGDLFIAIMDSPLKNELIDELKLYEMATY